MRNVRSLPLYLRFKTLSPLGWYIVSSWVEKRRYRALFGLGRKMRVFRGRWLSPSPTRKIPHTPLKESPYPVYFFAFSFLFLVFCFSFFFLYAFFFFLFFREKKSGEKIFLIFPRVIQNGYRKTWINRFFFNNIIRLFRSTPKPNYRYCEQVLFGKFKRG